MTKIYEALEQAGKSVKAAESGEAASSHRPLFSSSEGLIEVEMGKEMVRLYQNLQSLFPEMEGKIFQFVGSREGEGTSTIVREFARVATMKFGKWVVLMDADRHEPTQHHLLREVPRFGWEDAVKGEGSIDRALYRVGETPLFISPILGNSDSGPQVFNAPGMDPILSELKERFDLIVIDCPPAATYPDGLAICRMVDGVILVVEAERTRWPVVESVKENIERNGGKILGLVFNKRHFYIPGFVYRRL